MVPGLESLLSAASPGSLSPGFCPSSAPSSQTPNGYYPSQQAWAFRSRGSSTTALLWEA